MYIRIYHSISTTRIDHSISTTRIYHSISIYSNDDNGRKQIMWTLLVKNCIVRLKMSTKALISLLSRGTYFLVLLLSYPPLFSFFHSRKQRVTRYTWRSYLCESAQRIMKRSSLEYMKVCSSTKFLRQHEYFIHTSYLAEARLRRNHPLYLPLHLEVLYSYELWRRFSRRRRHGRAAVFQRWEYGRLRLERVHIFPITPQWWVSSNSNNEWINCILLGTRCVVSIHFILINWILSIGICIYFEFLFESVTSVTSRVLINMTHLTNKTNSKFYYGLWINISYSNILSSW